MTPELRRLVGDQARSLQLRLSQGCIDPVTAATEARRFFTDAADAVRTRWLNLELNGYGNLVDSTPLQVVLGVPSNDRLFAHVVAYRTQPGRIAGVQGPPANFRHFFVEPLGQLVTTSSEVAASNSGDPIELEFDVSARTTGHPARAVFNRDVFQRILAGFVAALHLQLGTLT